MIVARFEVEQNIMESLFGSAITMEQVMMAICPGMTITNPRIEEGTWVFEAVMPDDAIRKEKQGKVIVLTMQEVPETQYDYNIERRFKIV